MVSANVTGTAAGLQTNAVQASSTNGGNSSTSTAMIIVVAPPSITKAFGAPTITHTHSTTLSFTISNPNSATILSGVSFTDSLPSGLQVSTPNGLTNSCGGTVTATVGSSSVSLSGGSLAGGASCSVVADVTAVALGVQNNSVTVSSTNGGTGNTSHASITVNPEGPAVVSFNVLWGSESFNVTTSTRTRLPWQIFGIQVVFSKPVTQGDASSLTGLPVTGFSGLGTNTLTWNITPVSIGNFTVTLAATGSHALRDSSGNALNDGIDFTQMLKILWGDVNDDGVVDAADLALVTAGRTVPGDTPYNIFLDLNGDGVVNPADANIVKRQEATMLP
jgi:hypothetical protein